MKTRVAGERVTERLASLSGTHPIWVRVGTLFDGSNAAPLRDAHLVYDAERIRYAGPSEPPPEVVAEGRNAPHAELPHHTALPGLVEAHAHLFLDGAPVDGKERELYLKRPVAWMLERARSRLERLARLGIAAVRDGGDKHGVGLALQRETEGPIVESPGAAVYRRTRYGSFVGEPLEAHESPEACVAARAREGARRLKLMVSGIIDFKKGAVTAPPQMSAEEVAALAAAAKRHGMQTMAHASGAEGIQNAIDGGVATVEHGFFVTSDQLGRMRDLNIAWVPTFAPVQIQIDRAAELGWDEKVVSNLKRIIDGHVESLRRARAMGVTILAGSDAGSCGVPHGLGLLAELEQMERAGMEPRAILHAATGAASSFLGFPVGRLAAGHRTRLLFAAESPLETVTNLRKEKLIVFDGRVWEETGAPGSDGL